MAGRLCLLIPLASLLLGAWAYRPEGLAIMEHVQADPPVEPGVCVKDFGEGRFANQVLLLTSALEAAEDAGVKFLHLPADKDVTTIRKVLRLENGVWPLGATPSTATANLKVDCVADCNWYWTRAPCRWANGTNMVNRRKGEPTLLRRTLTDTGRLRCDEADFKHPDSSTLTMHMRAGDVLKMPWQGSGYHKLAPCEFWTQAVKHGNYSSALIVTQADPADPEDHPCISVVKEAFPGRVTVQSKSMLEDFCTIMNSHSLAVSFSTIGSVLLELTSHVRTVYAPSWVWGMITDRSTLLEKCVEMSFAGYPERWQNWPEKRDYLLAFPASGVSTKEKPCVSS